MKMIRDNNIFVDAWYRFHEFFNNSTVFCRDDVGIVPYDLATT